MSNPLSENSDTRPSLESDQTEAVVTAVVASTERQLVVAPVYRVYDLRSTRTSYNDCSGTLDEEVDDNDSTRAIKSLIDHAWSGRVLRLVSNRAKLMESFMWLSTVGGGYSALGERDRIFSARAGALSLGQQLHLAEMLGDERLKVMCHLFAGLAAIQMDNRNFCFNYIQRVIIPLINAMPYKDPIVINILGHICFRLSRLNQLRAARNNAIESSQSGKDQTHAEDLSTKQ